MIKSGIDLIAAERQRQIEEEGWTPDHDDQHTNGELALAAACCSGRAGIVEKRTATKLTH